MLAAGSRTVKTESLRGSLVTVTPHPICASRQYTIADWERARDRVAAAERRIDNDRTNNPNWGRAGLERAQLELSVITSQLRLRGLLE
jgi:hypothetical protein